jgi:hypothetical protein
MKEIEVHHDKRDRILYTPTAVDTVTRAERTAYLADLLIVLAREGRTILVLGELRILC